MYYRNPALSPDFYFYCDYILFSCLRVRANPEFYCCTFDPVNDYCLVTLVPGPPAPPPRRKDLVASNTLPNSPASLIFSYFKE